MADSNPLKVRFEVHFHAAAPGEVHFHLHSSSSAAPYAMSRTVPGGGPQRRAIRVRTPKQRMFGNVQVQDTGSGMGNICSKGNAEHPTLGAPVTIFAIVYHSADEVPGQCPPPSTMTEGEVDPASGDYFFGAIPGAQHSAEGEANWLLICAYFDDGMGGTLVEQHVTEFVGITSSSTDCGDGGGAQKPAAKGATGVRPSVFIDTLTGANQRKYLLHVAPTKKDTWVLRSAYGDFELPSVWNVEHDENSPEGEPRWVSRCCSKVDAQWRLSVHWEQDDLVGELHLLGVDGAHFDTPLVWRTRFWNPLGRNRVRPSAGDHAIEIIVEPAP